MAIKIPRGRADAIIKKIIDALREYEIANPRAQIDVYRQNPVSVRIRIVDPAFKGLENQSAMRTSGDSSPHCPRTCKGYQHAVAAHPGRKEGLHGQLGV
ncbi:MAG TPA: hypothetical protein VGY66_35655 [Gemmataceae bacterium]|jgi:hypothetical protein|nr:hypothetical protein [Gemmataceae bacterium]